VRRALRIGAGLGLALVIITCTDQSVTGPKYPGRAALDLRAWASAAPGAPVIPIDSLEITFRRADGSVALDARLGFRPDTLLTDSAVIRLNVDLHQNSETFTVLVRAFGSGVDWYRYSGSVQIAAGAVAQPALAGLYVGPGANGVRVVMRPPDTTVIGGTAFSLRALVYGAAGDSIVGVPIGYRLSDSTRGKVTYPTGTTATLTAALSLRDSVWVVAETPTHLKDSTRVHVLPPAARLLLQSGDKQTSVLNAALPAPLVVRVLDALNGGFKGDTVRWTVTTGTASLKAPISVSDSAGYAVMSATPIALGPFTVQAAVSGLQGSPLSFSATALLGTIVISPKIDTIGYGTAVQYTAVAKDALGNPVATTLRWTSTVPTIAGVSGSGIATALAGDSTKIIASAGGVADTARLYVRALRTVIVAPADTIVTAVGNLLQLRVAHLDNFGAADTSGFTTKYISATPSVMSVDVTGRVLSLGPGNGVVVVRDSVDSLLRVQSSAIIRVNQVTRTIFNRPGDSVTVAPTGQVTVVRRGLDSTLVGTSGQTQVLAVALDSNGYRIPGKTLSWVTRPLAVTGGPIATVTGSGLVTGVTLGLTYAVDTLVEGPSVFKDSTTVVVTTAAPKLLQWALDSTAVGSGSSISIALAVTVPSVTPLTISISSTDGTIAKAIPNLVTIPAGGSVTSATISGLKAGRAVLTATDVSGLYTSKQLIVDVVGAPKLALGLATSLTVGQKATITVSAEDANGAIQTVAQPLVVTLVSSRPSHTSFDSSTITIPAGLYSAQTGVTVDSAGGYTFSASAPNYVGASQSTTATGALVQMVAATSSLTSPSFSPLTVTISAGQYVTWKNTDAITHTTTSNAIPTPIWNSGNMPPGATYSVYFPTAGTYTYYCLIHGVAMSGTVVVP
jgi:plastocyanin